MGHRAIRIGKYRMVDRPEESTQSVIILTATYHCHAYKHKKHGGELYNRKETGYSEKENAPFTDLKIKKGLPTLMGILSIQG